MVACLLLLVGLQASVVCFNPETVAAQTYCSRPLAAAAAAGGGRRGGVFRSCLGTERVQSNTIMGVAAVGFQGVPSILDRHSK